MRDVAEHHFLHALSLNPYVWEAVEGLCQLGTCCPYDAHTIDPDTSANRPMSRDRPTLDIFERLKPFIPPPDTLTITATRSIHRQHHHPRECEHHPPASWYGLGILHSDHQRLRETTPSAFRQLTPEWASLPHRGCPAHQWLGYSVRSKGYMAIASLIDISVLLQTFPSMETTIRVIPISPSKTRCRVCRPSSERTERRKNGQGRR